MQGCVPRTRAKAAPWLRGVEFLEGGDDGTEPEADSYWGRSGYRLKNCRDQLAQS